MQAASIGRSPLGAFGDQEQPGDISGDYRLEAWPDHLDHHLFAAFQAGGMNLGYRGGCQWLNVEAAEYLTHLGAELVLDQRHGLLRVEWRYPVL